ncbi:suppressor of fused domain protein [Nocardia otitidiscaviarum]|uniref:suppressor of fused domain protein n=1 Tax=Nocardia otitidiscaviarum TaxID=1823 RepID=UPI0004A6C9B3|nr:suppressor of fused domain protein [Nocardia otitidiscaviarum]MBF6131812.1 suppressor of fused domain protein [Nocardia otitidiscaviarum]MBF6482943.1 suppressor of fused domain protein [Nocardia otitidiscaviarum]
MDVIDDVRAAVLGHFRVASADSASVTFLGLEPIEILRVPAGDLVHYVTLGGSRHPMTDPTAALADPLRGPRAELVLTQVGSAGASSGLVRALGVLVATPAVEGVVLQPDALLDLGEPLWHNARFTAVLLGASDMAEVKLPEPAEPVRFLTVTPITATEAAWVRIRGAAALRDAWTEAGIDVRDPDRGAANL